ncbi:palmitoyltransferase PFA3 [Uncinocarpus reesii 1704]|uniref:Palmitoyltransferase PFA3 n=1 Tax=Uncinocarpus reesii (strain UAMH 1704) TaxID=336963 RepID=C4JUM1_UNCRE|nr:palmitoyltransferase PFA3 [Uncinocarpus reesii 1704]EEP79982.1 palmitoyltransferase PFA3 [Uncinocarpus reesii 1704]
MEAFASAASESSIIPRKRRSTRLLRKCERFICSTAKYFPLVFVYAVSTWAVWIQATVGFSYAKSTWIGNTSAIAGIFFYACLAVSYTVAVFTDPGSPANAPITRSGKSNRQDYSHLPTTEVAAYNALTVNSSGGKRYCKKSTWVWKEMLTEARYADHALPVNVILLAIISGVIALVLTGFTAWHISLAIRGLTTIECLEKTRYLSPLRKTLDNQRRQFASYDGHRDTGFSNTLHSYGQQLVDMHANAIPGVTREEEGEERPSPTVTRPFDTHHLADAYNPNEHADNYRTPAQQSLYRSFGELERDRERDRYEEYLDERDSEKFPNAFDLGWRRNLTHLFGPNPLLWALPICSTIGDGWHWEPSFKWLEARRDIERQRLKRWEQSQGQGQQPVQVHYHPQRQSDQLWRDGYPVNEDSSAARFYDGPGEVHHSPAGVSMRTLPRPSRRQRPADEDSDANVSSDRYSTSSDEERGLQNPKHSSGSRPAGEREDGWRDWD